MFSFICTLNKHVRDHDVMEASCSDIIRVFCLTQELLTSSYCHNTTVLRLTKEALNVFSHCPRADMWVFVYLSHTLEPFWG